MFKIIEKYWPIISILLLLVLIAVLLFAPIVVGAFAIAMLILSLSIAIFFIVRRQMQVHRKNKIDRATMLRNIFFEVLGLSLTIALSVLLAQIVARTISPLMGNGWLSIGIVFGLSMLGGVGAAWLVKVTWGRLTKFSNDILIVN